MKETIFKRKSISLISVFLISLWFFLTIFPISTQAGEVVKKYMIAGKEWRAEKIEGEPQNYMIYWGDDQVKWEPRSWMPEYYLKEGPFFFERWMQPEPPSYPWDCPMEERPKLSAREIMKRSVAVAYHLPFVKNRVSTILSAAIDPKGRERLRKSTHYMTSYYLPEMKEKLPEEMRGVLAQKFMIIWRYPEDMRGFSILSYAHTHVKDRADEFWMYLPSLRRVKRVSEGSRQDYTPGTITRHEDFAITRPIHNYKVLGMELYEPDYDHYGFTGKTWVEENPKRFVGIGQPSWVIEETPYKENWWFAKQIKKINVQTFFANEFISYDEKGRLIRTMTTSQYLPEPVKYPLFLDFQTWPIHEITTGYKGYSLQGCEEIPCEDAYHYFNTDIPEEALSIEVMPKEYTTKALWWK